MQSMLNKNMQFIKLKDIYFTEMSSKFGCLSFDFSSINVLKTKVKRINIKLKSKFKQLISNDYILIMITSCENTINCMLLIYIIFIILYKVFMLLRFVLYQFYFV